MTRTPGNEGGVWLARLARAALVFIFAWFALGGIAHFVFTQAEMRIVPPWIPWPRAAVLVSGAFELLGAAGLLFRSTRRAALWGLFALTVAVTPANVAMLERAGDFPQVPYWALVLRLPFQAFLLWTMWWLARRAAASGAVRSGMIPP